MEEKTSRKAEREGNIGEEKRQERQSKLFLPFLVYNTINLTETQMRTPHRIPSVQSSHLFLMAGADVKDAYI